MEMMIERMVLDNFKGVQHAEYKFGKTTEIRGRNASGKTTIPDAFFWVLFNKDSAGHAPGSDDFHEKPLDQDGNEIHDLETSVEIISTLDGDPFTLRRAQRENWVKKRGQSEAVYQGNMSTYYINGVEVKASEFKQRIGAICSEKVFGLIARMSAMNNLPWQDRRAALVEMADLDVNEVLLRREEYAGLALECTTRGVTMDDLKKVLQANLRDVNRELTLIPARIDEAQRSLPQFGDFQVATAKETADMLPSRIDQIEKKLMAMKSGNSAMLRESTLAARRTELVAIQNAVMADHDRGRRELESDLRTATSRIAEANQRLSRVTSDRKENARRRDEIKVGLDALRNEYRAVYSEKFSGQVEDVCPVCGQALPEEYKAAAIEKARDAFLTDKKSRLEKINVHGQSAKRLMADAEAEDKQLASAEASLAEELRRAEEMKNLAESALTAYPAVPDYAVNPRYQELKNEIESLNADAGAPEADHGEIDALTAEMEKMKSELEDARRILAEAESGQRIQVRIAELNLRKRSAGDQAAMLERRIDLCGKFVADRCRLLEETIDGFFPTVRWKLFNTQINGGIADCCECMIPCGGSLVPYQGANTGSKLHADMEIINVMSRHYGITLPLFFDNREAVNEIPAMDGQLITLSVSSDAELNFSTK